jgi:hypothetical protein
MTSQAFNNTNSNMFAETFTNVLLDMGSDNEKASGYLRETIPSFDDLALFIHEHFSEISYQAFQVIIQVIPAVYPNEKTKEQIQMIEEWKALAEQLKVFQVSEEKKKACQESRADEFELYRRLKDEKGTLAMAEAINAEYESLCPMFIDIAVEEHKKAILGLKEEPKAGPFEGMSGKEIYDELLGAAFIIKYIMFGGSHSKEGVNMRKADVEKMKLVMEASEATAELAQKVLKDLIDSNGGNTGGTAEMGPLKTNKGTFAKIIRKKMGLTKDGVKNEHAKRKTGDKLILDIKDVIRGTITFKSESGSGTKTAFEQLVEGYEKALKYFRIGKSSANLCAGIVKCETTFGFSHTGCGYRDAKMVVLVKVPTKARQDLEKKGIVMKNCDRYRHLPFEIQFQTYEGGLAKSCKYNGTKEYETLSQHFDAINYAEDSLNKFDQLYDLTNDDDTFPGRAEDMQLLKDLKTSFPDGIMKGHHAYKEKLTKAGREAYDMYARIYDCGYRASGFNIDAKDDDQMKQLVQRMDKAIKAGKAMIKK